jgi:hypothetical protein
MTSPRWWGVSELKLTLLLFLQGGKTRIGVAPPELPEPLLVEVDAHGQQIGAERAHAEAVELRQLS